MNNIKNIGIKKIAIIIVSMILLTGVAYASVTVAKDRKSSYLPWQGTVNLFYDSAHNVGDDYNPESRFTDLGDTVSDSVTNLEWQKDGGKTPERKYNWAEAKTYCADLDLGGKDDWKLPNIKEFRSIVDYSKINPSIDSKFTNTASNYYWSSTTYENNTSTAWYVHFSGGYSFTTGKTTNLYVRCTR